MSIRVTIYDFFAYTVPGVFYLLIGGFWLGVFRVIIFDVDTLSDRSLSILSSSVPLLILLLFGAGYITGLLMDSLALRWIAVFRKRNRDAAKHAFEVFCQRYEWLDVRFMHSDWPILLFVIKTKSIDISADVEGHNVTYIMLRNISLGFLLIALGYFSFFIFVSENIWNMVFVIVSLLFSAIALRRSSARRDWFYTGIFEAFLALNLSNEKLSNENVLSIANAGGLEERTADIQHPILSVPGKMDSIPES
ncbi:MAG: hypothetical protein KJZ86_18670 [Caldilineaceae bacterium]|nr:hypothetical protein [Caldilineaceae bacterium]